MTRSEIRTARRRIHDGSLDRRLARAQGILTRADQDLPRINNEIEGVIRDYQHDLEAHTGRRPHPEEIPRIDREELAKARSYALGAWAARLFEGMFAVVVGVNRFNLPTGWAIVVAIFVTALLSLIGEAVAMRVCRADRPHLSERRAGLGTAICATLLVVALLPVVAARTVEAAAYFVDPALVILTFVLPILAGFLAVVAFLLRWSQRYVQAHRRLLMEKSDTQQFRRELSEFLNFNNRGAASRSLPSAARFDATARVL